MAYTDELKQLIKRVKLTRDQRLTKKREGWEFPRMNLRVEVRSIILAFLDHSFRIHHSANRSKVRL